MRIAVPSVLSPRAFADHDPRAPVIRLDGETMGTVWRIALAAPATLDETALRTAIAARLASLVSEMSHWDAQSHLCRFNRAPAGSWFSLPSDFAAVITAALDVAELSGGAFDPALGALVDLWGFGPPGPRARPSDDAVAAARARSGRSRLAFDQAARRLRQPGGLQLDLSGIAKGYAVDAVAALLRKHGANHALVEVGGELAGMGMRPDGDPWWVDLENPPALGLPLFRVALHECAVATSGNYVRGDHNIDPATGRPAANGVVSVSVIADTAMLADAWASALAVLGPDQGMAAAETHRLAARIVSIGPKGTRETISPALAAML